VQAGRRFAPETFIRQKNLSFSLMIQKNQLDYSSSQRGKRKVWEEWGKAKSLRKGSNEKSWSLLA
jgi:hypothetical protein